MNKVLSLFIVYSFFVFFCPQPTHAYLPDKTHPLINQSAMLMSVLPEYAKNVLGLRDGDGELLNGKRLFQWVREGGTQEDKPAPRGAYHFFDPTKTWSNAGLSGWLGIQFYSNLDWALNKTSAPSIPCEESITVLGTTTCPETSNPDTSWIGARNYFYQALISSNSNDRGILFGKGFKSVGHVLHLLADVAVPEHVRNDWHVFGSSYEAWVEDQVLPDGFNDDGLFNGFDVIENFISQNSGSNHVPYSTITSLSNPEGYVPISNFWDTTPSQAVSANSGDTTIMPGFGLAEYTNFNFMSQDTNESYVYPVIPPQNHVYVQSVTDEDGDNHMRIYFSGTTTDGKPVNHLVSAGLLGKHLKIISPQSIKNAEFELDENCYNDYASILVPKAVDYDIALINYFFRGTLSFATHGVYAIADGSQTPYPDGNGNQQQQFTKITTWVENTTPNESLGNGTITAVARYKVVPNYASDLSNYPPDTSSVTEYTYSVSAGIPVNEGDFASGYYTSFDFDFGSNPIPAGITDLTLQVVFKGTIGNEKDIAVAVGMLDLMEPTHLTFWNSTDMFDLKYTPSTGPTYSLYLYDELVAMAQNDSELFNQLNFNKIGTLADDPILQPFDSTFDISFWDGWTWVPATTVTVPPAGHIRMIALVGSKENNGVLFDYTYPGGSNSVQYSFNGVVNQVNQDGNYPAATPVKTFRKRESTNGTFVPFYQQFSQTIVGCYPVQTTDQNGNPVSCPYADDMALPIQNVSPITFTSVFN